MGIFNKKTKQTDEQPAEQSAIGSVPVKQDAKKPAGQVKQPGQSTFGILIRPLITEKATNLGRLNQYVFEVSSEANKIQIAQAIFERYGVKPTKVNIINNLGKRVRYGRNWGRRKDWTKAVITLPAGQTIAIHEGV